MNETTNKYRTFCICLILALATLAVFWQVRHHEFVSFDDDLYIFNNNHVKAGLTLKGLVWAFTSTHAYNWHPLTWLSHMLDGELYGSEPAGHHLTNVLFHIANAILLLLVLQRLTGGFWASAFVAATFALHPLHVESVAWTSERKDVLSTFFWLLTMWFYIRYVRQPKVGRYLVVLLVFALGLMAKQMLVTLPFVLLLLDYWPLRRPVRRVVIEKLPLLFLSLVASVVVYLVQRHTGVIKSFQVLPMAYSVQNALISYVVYIGKMFWPSHLAVFYPHQGDALSGRQAGLSALLLVLITTAVFRKARRHPYLVVGWLWYLGTLVPVIGLVQVGLQARADRYTYVPLTGLFIMIAWGAPELLARWRYRKVVLSLSAAAVFLALGITSWFQVKCWQNSITLYTHAVTVVKNNWWAHNTLGSALVSKGRLDEAVCNYHQAFQIRPNFADAYYNLANVLVSQGRLDEAVSCYRRAIYLRPGFAEAHYNLADTFSLQGRFDEAVTHYRQTIYFRPDFAKAHYNLANMLKSQSKLDEAIDCYKRALRLEPDFPEAHYNLANTLKSQGKLDKAISHYQQAIRLKSDFHEAHYNLANALQSQGKIDEAISHYRQALRAKPDWPLPMAGIALILTTHPDPKMRDAPGAVALAERAAELTKHQDAAILNTLASAYASAGEYQRAAITAQSALDLASAAKNEKLAENIRRQLELYRKQAKP